MDGDSVGRRLVSEGVRLNKGDMEVPSLIRLDRVYDQSHLVIIAGKADEVRFVFRIGQGKRGGRTIRIQGRDHQSLSAFSGRVLALDLLLRVRLNAETLLDLDDEGGVRESVVVVGNSLEVVSARLQRRFRLHQQGSWVSDRYDLLAS